MSGILAVGVVVVAACVFVALLGYVLKWFFLDCFRYVMKTGTKHWIVVCVVLTLAVSWGMLFVGTQTDTKVVTIEHKFTEGKGLYTAYCFSDIEGNVYKISQDTFTHGDKWTKKLKYNTYPHVRYAKIVEGREYEIRFYKYSAFGERSLREEEVKK